MMKSQSLFFLGALKQKRAESHSGYLQRPGWSLGLYTREFLSLEACPALYHARLTNTVHGPSARDKASKVARFSHMEAQRIVKRTSPCNKSSCKEPNHYARAMHFYRYRGKIPLMCPRNCRI